MKSHSNNRLPFYLGRNDGRQDYIILQLLCNQYISFTKFYKINRYFSINIIKDIYIIHGLETVFLNKMIN